MSNLADTASEYADYVPAPEVAELCMSPEHRAANTLQDVGGDTAVAWQDACLKLHKQVEAIESGDARSLTSVLCAQLSTLDALFHRSIRDALIQPSATWASLYFQVAMRAQAQSARTACAIAAIKQKPIIVIDQPAESGVDGGSEQGVQPTGERIPNLVRLAQTDPEADAEEEQLVAGGA